jgi:hypothetical protein
MGRHHRTLLAIMATAVPLAWGTSSFAQYQPAYRVDPGTTSAIGANHLPGDEPKLQLGDDSGRNQSGALGFLVRKTRGSRLGSNTAPVGKAIHYGVPCPDADFNPDPGQSLETFLTEEPSLPGACTTGAPHSGLHDGY